MGTNTIDVRVSAQDETLIQARATTKVYTVTVIRGGNVTVNPGAGSYATVKDAFDKINDGTHTGAVTVSIIGDTAETVAAVLNASGTGSASYTSVMITPSGARTVSGSLATPLIDLAGADNVTIDGLNASGNSLVISNTSTAATAGTSTIRFINGATNNIVRNCTISGSSTGAVAVALATSSSAPALCLRAIAATLISNNNIGPAGANLPTKGVMGLGTAANKNSDDVIDNNNIFDFFSPTISVSGINVQANNTLWTISNNRLYQTASRVFTGLALRYAGITLNFLDTGSFWVAYSPSPATGLALAPPTAPGRLRSAARPTSSGASMRKTPTSPIPPVFRTILFRVLTRPPLATRR